MTTEKNDAPSAEAMKRYEPDDLAAAIAMLRGYSISAPLVAARIAEMVYDERRRVRREARAEAFEEGVEALEELRWASTSNDLVDGAKALRALAAKERAK